MNRALHFYFDYLSPYAYLALRPVRALCERRGLALEPHPVLLAALLSSWGQLGPAEIPPKRVFTFKDIARRAHDAGVAMAGPKAHPFRPLTALRVSLREVAGHRQLDVIQAIYDAGWGRGIDLGSDEELRDALNGAGFDGEAMIARTREPEVKRALERETNDAIEHGVFGVPSMRIGDELFWGQDRLADIDRYLDGNDPVDPKQLEQVLSRPAAAKRRG